MSLPHPNHAPGRERSLFEHALELPPGPARDAFLSAECAGDLPLRNRIAVLLAAHEEAPWFLADAPTTRPPAPVSRSPAAPGDILGPYKLLESIGEGGFGVVFMAEQTIPFRRRVALKVIKPGMDSRPIIARFEAERQALALMDHPNIARVLEAGTTEAGLPFFVMELVRGIPITQFCQEQALDLPARLNLVIQVCSAVQHAHQKGVIHRDLKPTNVLVTLHGDQPVPKVIDFGIAKAIHEPLTNKTVFTLFQQFLGTPAYMSPEQAALSGIDVDTRSDIYSLGVLLYELLTGSPPFDTKDLLNAGLDEMRKTICEREPERPSARLTSRSQDRVTRQVGLPTPHFPSRISRELDLIVLKALEKERDRRYATANGLAADLQRFLNQEPVTAVAPTLAYQLAKLYRRNRRAVMTGAAFVTVLLTAAVASTALAIRAHRAEVLARSQAATAYNVNEFLWKELLKRLTPWSYTNASVSLREAFERAAGNIDQRLAQQPLAEASIRFSFGKTYLGLSELEAAEIHLLRALDLQRTHGGPPDERMADTLFMLGTLREFQGRWQEAEARFVEAASIRENLLGVDDRDSVSAASKAALNQARLLPPDEAEPLLVRTLERARRINSPEHHVSRAVMNRLGQLWLEQEQWNQAGALFEESYRLAAAEEGIFSPGVIEALNLLAVTRMQQDRFAEAAPVVLKLAAATRITLPTHEPAVAQFLRDFLAAWEAKGDSPDLEPFRQQAAAYWVRSPPRD